MDPLSTIETTWWLGIPVAALAGVFLGLNPLALPVTGTAASLGFSGAAAGGRSAIRLVAAFGTGMIVVYTAVGLFAGRIDELLEGVLRPYEGWGHLVLAGILLALAAWFVLRPAGFCHSCAQRGARNPALLAAFLAGIPGGFVNCPACAAIVTGVAASAAKLGSPLYAAAVMCALGAGHAGVLVAATHLLSRGRSFPASWGRGAFRLAALPLVAAAAYLAHLAAASGLGSGPRLP